MTAHASGALTARHLPEIRAELAAWLADPGPDGGPAAWSNALPHDDAEAERRDAARWALWLRMAELYCVSADMTRLAVSAGMALPSYRLHPEDLPSTHGLLLWEEPATDSYDGTEQVGAPIIGASWATSGSAVQVRLWCRQDDWLRMLAEPSEEAGLEPLPAAAVRELRIRYPQQIVSMSTGRLPFGTVPGWLAAAPADTRHLSPAEMADHVAAETRHEQAERALVVSWLLMGQTLTRQEDVQAPRAAVRRIARIDPRLMGATRYVQLRHQTVAAEERGTGEGAGRQARHRWVVRGHWRNQYYPSRQGHRPIWIDAHLRGPDGAPILDPDKLVNILHR